MVADTGPSGLKAPVDAASTVPAARRIVGREAERRLVTALLEEPTSVFVVLVGEPGVGKTTLLDDAARDQIGRGRLVVRARAEATGGSQLDLWRRPAQRLGIVFPERDASVAVADHVRVLVDLLRDGLIANAPALVILDDLHWAGSESLAVLRQLVDELSGQQVLVAAATRTSDDPALSGILTRAHEIRLGALNEAETAELAQATTGEPLRSEQARELHRRTGGVPLLVREVLRNGSTPGKAAADVLEATLGRAGEDELGVLSVLALGGTDLPLPVLTQVCAATPERVQEILDAAVLGEVLTLEDGVLHFRHGLLAEAAAKRLSPDEQRRRYAALAAAWRQASNAPEYAGNLVRALPTRATVEDVVQACELAADGLIRSRRSADAVALLRAAVAACEHAGADPSARARLALTLGNALWDTGDMTTSLEVFAHGSQLEVDDLELGARLEVARHRSSMPVEPDPQGRARLLELDVGLGGRDSLLQVELLGRIAALAQQAPIAPELAEEATTRALSVARRLDDPAGIVRALLDRFLWVTTPERLRERDGCADEVITLARRAERPDLLRVGLSWRLEAELASGDFAAARATADENSVLAAVSPSADWRVAALRSQVVLAALSGDRRRASELAHGLEDAVAAANPPLQPLYAIGYVTQTYTTLARHFQLVDPHVGELFDRHRWLVDDHRDNTMIQLHAATNELVAGRPGAARARIGPWLREPGRFTESATPLLTLTQLADLVVALQCADGASAVLAELRPWSRRVVAAEQIESVDLLLAQLANLTGDHHAALVDGARALANAIALGSPTLEAASHAAQAAAYDGIGESDRARTHRARSERLAGRVGMVLHQRWEGSRAEGAVRPVAEPAELARGGQGWTVTYAGRCFDLPPTRGVAQLARLLAQPGREVAATSLAGYDQSGAPPVNRGLGPVLDARAKQAYRRRLLELQTQLDEADRVAAAGASIRAQAEYDALLAQLRAATGLGGRDRPQQDGYEHARVNVTRCLRRAIEAIEARADDLGHHLSVSVRTGHWCSYDPDPTTPIRWEVRG